MTALFSPLLAPAENRWIAKEGAPRPLGSHHVPESNSYNFALYSKHASSVTLLLFASDGDIAPRHEYRLDPLVHKSGRIWHCRIPAAQVEEAPLYGYRVDGPHDLTAGHRFDPGKVLLDPFARAVAFPPDFSRMSVSRLGRDPGRPPLGIAPTVTRDFDWTGDRRPRHSHDTVIYELHVRGFTRNPNSGVASGRAGTYSGVIDKIPYLRELGVTAVELLPVFQFDPGEGNYWGYMPLSFFAPHQGYAMSQGRGEEIDEFRAMVKALHQADIEIILDVVYNHTAEGNETGPTYSFRGIDNSTYYLLEEDRSRYRNDSGTGNVLHTANRHVQAMVLASMRYWVREMHIDGFRFDLASLFTRADDGSVNLDDPPIISAIQSDPDLADVRLIAEAWDMSSYQLGRSFPGLSWLQWNGQFRDQVRAALRGDAGHTGKLMQRLYGSDDLFPDTLEGAYHAYQSVNFVTCHDGFCLYDLLAYNRKNNWANGHGNTDGPDQNFSWNCGWEGDVDVPNSVLELRRRQAKNHLAILLLANGTPMLLAGDEFLHTQHGNNNPYNQDNPTTWLDWNRLTRHAEIFRFCKAMIAFRKRHPSLGRSRFWRDDVSWHGENGPVNHGARAARFAVHLRGASQQDQDIYIIINCDPDGAWFRLPGIGWHRAMDTARAAPDDVGEAGSEPKVAADCYFVQGRSVVVLICPERRGAA